MKTKTSYIVITPVRDEEECIEKTLLSMIKQTILPKQWVLVNDGSIDKTLEILEKYAIKYPWISVVNRENRGYRKSGGGVIEAFYDGYSKIKEKKYDFLVKLDGDLSFNEDYFEKCFKNFEVNPKLGIGGGSIISISGSKKIYEKFNLFHVRGATKIYRKECWSDIGYLIKAPGWDTLDEVKANMKNWQTETFPKIPIYQHKLTGAADGVWKNWVKNGRANYISGYHPLFMVFKCIIRLWKKPVIIMSVALFWGYITGYTNRVPQIDESDLIKYIRQQQVNKLLFKKSIW